MTQIGHGLFTNNHKNTEYQLAGSKKNHELKKNGWWVLSWVEGSVGVGVGALLHLLSLQENKIKKPRWKNLKSFDGCCHYKRRAWGCGE